MRLNHFICFLLLLWAMAASAQKLPTAASDSILGDALNELIKCTSTGIITDRVCPGCRDSAYIAPFHPAVDIEGSRGALMLKQNKKVNYTAYLSSAKDKTTAEKELLSWSQKIQQHLDLWLLSRLPNGDKSLGVSEDYFFTNSEDETSVRIDIVKKGGYHTRIQIY